MTPKEKAEELIEKFKYYSYRDEHYMTPRFKMIESHIYSAKECAIIAVDEILELDVRWFDQSLVNDYPKRYKPEQTTEFWEEVKNELKNLY